MTTFYSTNDKIDAHLSMYVNAGEAADARRRINGLGVTPALIAQRYKASNADAVFRKNKVTFPGRCDAGMPTDPMARKQHWDNVGRGWRKHPFIMNQVQTQADLSNHHIVGNPFVATGGALQNNITSIGGREPIKTVHPYGMTNWGDERTGVLGPQLNRTGPHSYEVSYETLLRKMRANAALQEYWKGVPTSGGMAPRKAAIVNKMATDAQQLDEPGEGYYQVSFTNGQPIGVRAKNSSDESNTGTFDLGKPVPIKSSIKYVDGQLIVFSNPLNTNPLSQVGRQQAVNVAAVPPAANAEMGNAQGPITNTPAALRQMHANTMAQIKMRAKQLKDRRQATIDTEGFSSGRDNAITPLAPRGLQNNVRPVRGTEYSVNRQTPGQPGDSTPYGLRVAGTHSSATPVISYGQGLTPHHRGYSSSFRSPGASGGSPGHRRLRFAADMANAALENIAKKSKRD